MFPGRSLRTIGEAASLPWHQIPRRCSSACTAATCFRLVTGRGEAERSGAALGQALPRDVEMLLLGSEEPL